MTSHTKVYKGLQVIESYDHLRPVELGLKLMKLLLEFGKWKEMQQYLRVHI